MSRRTWVILGTFLLAGTGALFLVLEHLAPSPAQASGPEMSLGARGKVDCGGDTLPAPEEVQQLWECTVTFDPEDIEGTAPFQITVDAAIIPDGGYVGFVSQISFRGLEYAARPSCQDEVVWPDHMGACGRGVGGTSRIGHTGFTGTSAPFRMSDYVGALVEVDVRCIGTGTFFAILTTALNSTNGAGYFLEPYNVAIGVKPTGTDEVAAGDTSLKTVEVADVLRINCEAGEPVPQPSPLKGDVNCDDLINSIDALLILQFDAGLVGVLECQENADVNGDDLVNALDALLVLQLDAGKLQERPRTITPRLCAPICRIYGD